MKKTGFTLIELLVVIAIIAILAAILYPIFTKVKGKALGAKCLANAKQIGHALLLYQDDNDGFAMPAWMPDAGGPNNICGRAGWAWYDLISKDVGSVFSHSGKSGKSAGCSGLQFPSEGTLLGLNSVVHMRHLQNAYGIEPPANSDMWAATYWANLPTKDTDEAGNPIMGSQRAWANTLHESAIHSPASLVSMAETGGGSNFGGGAALMPSVFLYRGVYHQVFSARLHGCPQGADEHGYRATVLYCDGHVEAVKCRNLGGPMGDPAKWNNSPFPDAGGWNRNRSASTADDIYHGTGQNEARPARAFTGWIPSDQLLTDISLGGTDNVLREWSWSFGAYQTIFDEDMTYGEYNTEARPDAKYDE